ncbi:MAG: hypothetical protein H7251_18275 [Acetobacteraceae bacterium]|nr:hypothetical protein [Acetobacteraceae bacterium]
MNFIATPFALRDTAPELARRFAMIMAGLGALVARRFLRMPHLVGFTLLVWGRLNGAVRQFHRALVEPTRVRAPRAWSDRAADLRGRPSGLPRGKGWIVRELGWEAAAYLVQLETLLGEITTRAALAAGPGAGRVLRPICQMLGVPAGGRPEIVPAVAVVPPILHQTWPNPAENGALGGEPDRLPMRNPIFAGG